MWFYELNLTVAVTFNILLLLLCYKSNSHAQANVSPASALYNPRKEASQFQRRFFLAYAFAVGADWLQAGHLCHAYHC